MYVCPLGLVSRIDVSLASVRCPLAISDFVVVVRVSASFVVSDVSLCRVTPPMQQLCYPVSILRP